MAALSESGPGIATSGHEHDVVGPSQGAVEWQAMSQDHGSFELEPILQPAA